MYKHPLLDRDKMSPQEALDILIEGNERFVNEIESEKDFKSLIHLTKEKQHPFASVLSCSDSRAPVELLFDQALGDVFSVRLAGNIASDKGIGSLEFGSKYLGAKLIVVMGHTSCGAVKAACDDFKDGHIGEIINMIKDISEQNSEFDISLCNDSMLLFGAGATIDSLTLVSLIVDLESKISEKFSFEISSKTM